MDFFEFTVVTNCRTLAGFSQPDIKDPSLASAVFDANKIIVIAWWKEKPYCFTLSLFPAESM